MSGWIWIDGVPRDDGVSHGVLPVSQLTGCVLHRTYGSWPGDYSIIKNNGLCHLLIGKDEGQWVQFDGLNGLQYHCGSNWWGPGIEFTGVNEDPLTDWQLRAGGYVINQIAQLLGVPLVYDDGQGGWTPTPIVGFHAHAGIIPDGGGSQHTNTIHVEDWNIMVGVAPVPEPVPEPEPAPPPLPPPPPPHNQGGDMYVAWGTDVHGVMFTEKIDGGVSTLPFGGAVSQYGFYQDGWDYADKYKVPFVLMGPDEIQFARIRNYQIQHPPGS